MEHQIPRLPLSHSTQVPQGTTDVQPEVTSYYHPNLTINLVDDHTRWVEGSIPQPMDKCKYFNCCGHTVR